MTVRESNDEFPDSSRWLVATSRLLGGCEGQAVCPRCQAHYQSRVLNTQGAARGSARRHDAASVLVSPGRIKTPISLVGLVAIGTLIRAPLFERFDTMLPRVESHGTWVTESTRRDDQGKRPLF
jgi:hypothetical protein